MIENLTIDSTPPQIQCDAWQRLWEVLLEPEPEPLNDKTEADDQER